MSLVVDELDDVEKYALTLSRTWKENDRLKVVFISQQYTYWNSFASVAREMIARNDRFDASILLVPYQGVEKGHIRHIQHPAEDLKKSGFPIRTPENYNIYKEKPHLAFITTPYSGHRDMKYHRNMLMLQGTLTALIPYCTDFMGDGEFIESYYAECDLLWRIFTAGSLGIEAYKVYAGIPARNVVVAGNPEYDLPLNSAPENLPKYQKIREMAAGRKVILWSPHYKTMRGWATWHILGIEIARLLAGYHDEFFVVMRPHPILMAFMLQWRANIFAGPELDGISEIVNTAPNFWLDTDDLAIESVFAADAVIADMSSILTKAMSLGKSVLFTYGKEGSGAGMALPILSEFVHNSTDLAGVESFLKMMLSGEDPLLPLPMEVMESFCGPADGNCGKRIVDYLENYFFQK